MRIVSALLLAACLNLPAIGDNHDTAEAPVEIASEQATGVYRYGATYEFTNTATASDCQKLCDTRSACVAWSYMAGFDGGASRCELKRGAGKVEYNPRATSGLSAMHENQFQPVLQNTDELEGGADLASPPSDKPEPLVATDPT